MDNLQNDLFKNVFALQKYFQEMKKFEYVKETDMIKIDDVEFRLEYLRDLYIQLDFISQRVQNLIDFINLNCVEKI